MFESSNLGFSARANLATLDIATSAEDRHPLAHIKSLVDDLCEGAKAAVAQCAPLIRAALLQALYSFTTDDQLLEQLRYNALYRWSVSIPTCNDGVRSDAARTSRLDRARSAILRRISDPTLDADAVAEELHMSRRALYLLFERYGMTPTRAIREIRLECCLRMLRDEHQCHRKIADIAMDHGFKHFASFSRQFKMRYGISPSSVLPSITKHGTAMT
jgi:AraC-like DNA-binding protein